MRWGRTDRTTRLKRIFRIVTGATPATAEPDYWDGDIVWVTPEDLATRDGRCIARSERMITDAGFSRCGTTMIPPGSLILSTRAPIGYVALSNVSLCFNQGCKALVPRQEEQARYWLYVMRSRREELRSWGRGATYDELGTQQLKDFSVPWPKLEHQRLASDYLDAETGRIDALVERKVRFIELLLEKRAALITHAVTKGLDPNIEMKDSGMTWIGQLPSDWEVMTLRRAVAKFIDYRGQTPTKTNDGVPLVTARNIVDSRVRFEDSAEFVSQSTYTEWMTRGFPSTGDVILTTEAPLGSVARIEDPGVALAQRIILFKTLPMRMRPDFLRLYFLSRIGRAELEHRATGSTALGIKASHLRAVRVVVPPLSVQEEIVCDVEASMAEIDRLVGKTRQSVELLKEYRTALISAAVTGQIDVVAKQAEVVV